MGAPAEDPPPGVPDWILTYGDLMSLLLCFFVLIASFSEMKSEEKNAIVKSIIRQFGDPAQARMIVLADRLNASPAQIGATLDPENPKAPNRRKAQVGAEGPIGSRNTVQTIRDGRRKIIGGPLLFDPGGATLVTDGKDAIRNVARSLKGQRSMVDVRGFEPIGKMASDSKFADPMDLAFARARAVVDFLASDCNIDRSRCRISMAAPIEARDVPRLKSGELMRERVIITTQESVGRGYLRGTAPGTTIE